MKVAVILEQTLTVGGGFNQALNAIQQAQKVLHHNDELIVLTPYEDNINQLKKINITGKLFKLTLLDKLYTTFMTLPVWLLIIAKFKLRSSFEKKLIQENIDLVYFVTPSHTVATLQKTNYIFTVWDLCHRDTPEFPEVRERSEFHIREALYKNYLSSALVVITDSEELVTRTHQRYGIDRERLLAMPFSPSPFLHTETIDIKEKYQLPEQFYYYPAQFWPHKNHIRILNALCLLRNEGITANVVFSGSNFNAHLSHIKAFISDNQLEEQVQILGFIPSKDVSSIYQACHALIMPTYFGPTNLPPLEAWQHRKPVVYSSHLRNHTQEAALLIDVDSTDEVASSIKRLLKDKDLYDCLVQKGQSRLKEIEVQRLNAEQKLKEKLSKFKKRLSCWH